MLCNYLLFLMNWSMVNFSDQMSFSYLMISQFSDFLNVILLVIMTMIMFIMIMSVYNSYVNINNFDFNSLELSWTIIPIFLLLYIMYPSLKVLYSNESSLVYDYQISLKVVGHQWYWSTLLDSNMVNLNFSCFSKSFPCYLNSYLPDVFKSDNLFLPSYMTENKCILPEMMPIRLMVSSDDVIHSWCLPNMGIKVDAMPGRVSNMDLFFFKSGFFFGQCSEICGVNHSLMPYFIMISSIKDFIVFLISD